MSLLQFNISVPELTGDNLKEEQIQIEATEYDNIRVSINIGDIAGIWDRNILSGSIGLEQARYIAKHLELAADKLEEAKAKKAEIVTLLSR